MYRCPIEVEEERVALVLELGLVELALRETPSGLFHAVALVNANDHADPGLAFNGEALGRSPRIASELATSYARAKQAEHRAA